MVPPIPPRWPFPWPREYPWDYAWLIPIALSLGAAGLDKAQEVCEAVRKKGREHGKELVQHL